MIRTSLRFAVTAGAVASVWACAVPQQQSIQQPDEHDLDCTALATNNPGEGGRVGYAENKCAPPPDDNIRIRP